MNEIHETIHPASSDSSIPTVSTVPAVPAPPEVAPAPAAAEPAVSPAGYCPRSGNPAIHRYSDRIRSTAIHGGLVCALFPSSTPTTVSMIPPWARVDSSVPGHHPRPGGPWAPRQTPAAPTSRE